MKERDLAKCHDFDFGLHNGCAPVLLGHFDYEGGSSQGVGCIIEVAFLVRFLAVFGVESLKEVNGLSCWVTHDNGKIYLIEPLHKKEGKAFDLEAWTKWVQARGPGFSPHELLTGELPPTHFSR